MQNQDLRIYLASASPRRRELLLLLGLQPERLHTEIDETPLDNESAQVYTERLARAKAEVGQAKLKEFGLPVRPLLSADTTVVVDGEILGKPQNEEDARRMLRKLSNREHQVITSVAIACAAELEVTTSVTYVTFKALSEAEIERYIATREPFDKAGAYGIQGLAGLFVMQICGSYTGVMGLPLYETGVVLSKFGYTLP